MCGLGRCIVLGDRNGVGLRLRLVVFAVGWLDHVQKTKRDGDRRTGPVFFSGFLSRFWLFVSIDSDPSLAPIGVKVSR